MDSLFHLLREPREKRDKNPLLLLLHGYGSNEEDLFSFASELPGEYFVISARAPYDLHGYGYAWYAINFDADANKFSDVEQAKRSRDRIVSFIEFLPKKYAIDAANITLVGFSQGSILSYSIALSHPEKICRVVAMSGCLDVKIVDENFRGNDFSNLKMFISHGTQDQVVPVEWERQGLATLDELKIDYTYKEYPIGHGVSPQNFFDVVSWLKNS